MGACYNGHMQSSGCPPIHGVVETVLYSDDLPRALAFYREVLGLAEMKGDHERFVALDAGAEEYLLKPFAPDKLAERVKAILAKFGK